MTDLQEFIKNKGISNKSFAEQTGIPYSRLSRALNGKEPITTFMVSQIESIFSDFSLTKEPLPLINEIENGKEIPFHGEVYATISEAMADVVAYGPQTFVNIPIFSQGEFALQASGHSMKGYINQGDWIVVKKINNRAAIIYGECYVVVTKGDNLKTVKFVKEHKDSKRLWLIPYNIEQFDGQTILKDDIIEMYSVVGLFRKI